MGKGAVQAGCRQFHHGGSSDSQIVRIRKEITQDKTGY
jgi:hypothetical protein